MPEKRDYYNDLLTVFLDVGESMVFAGAEIGRVEDTLTRMAKAYGAQKVDIFALTSIIFLTVKFEDDITITQQRRTFAGGQTNFVKIDQLNALSRRCCQNTLSPEDLKREIAKINENKINKFSTYVGSVLAAAGFAVFFEGTLLDAVVSGLFAVVICLISDFLSPRMPNKVFYYFITSLLVGSAICLVAKYCPVLSADIIIIGDIMVLVPGVAMTTSVKNILIGDTLSAVVRFAECLVWTCALAGGFMIPISILLGG